MLNSLSIYTYIYLYVNNNYLNLKGNLLDDFLKNSSEEKAESKSFKEVGQPVRIEENQNIEPISELARDQPKLQSIKSKKSDGKENSIAVQSSSKIENASNVDLGKAGMKKVQPKTVKDTHNSLKIKNVAEAEGMASFSDENIKEAVVP